MNLLMKQFKLLGRILVPIEGLAVDALCIGTLLMLCLTAIALAYRVKGTKIFFIRRAMQTVSLFFFVLYFHLCVCAIREWVFGFHALGANQNEAFRNLVIPTIVIGSAFLGGRAFCGWVCPLGFYLELLGNVDRLWKRRRFGKRGAMLFLTLATIAAVWITIRFRPETQQFAELIAAIWAVLLLLFLFFLVPRREHAGRYHWLRYFSMSMYFPITFVGIYATQPWCVVYGNEADYASIVALVGVSLATMVFSISWCRFICPLGAVLSMVSRVSLLRRHFPPGTKPRGKCVYGALSRGRLETESCFLCGRCEQGKNSYRIAFQEKGESR